MPVRIIALPRRTTVCHLCANPHAKFAKSVHKKKRRQYSRTTSRQLLPPVGCRRRRLYRVVVGCRCFLVPRVTAVSQRGNCERKAGILNPGKVGNDLHNLLGISQLLRRKSRRRTASKHNSTETVSLKCHLVRLKF